jgi:hypothetical protein
MSAGQQVAGELDALEVQAERLGEHVRERGLADAGQVLDQQVAARQQAGEGEAHLCLLAEDDAAAAPITRSIARSTRSTAGIRPSAACGDCN